MGPPSPRGPGTPVSWGSESVLGQRQVLSCRVTGLGLPRPGRGVWTVEESTGAEVGPHFARNRFLKEKGFAFSQSR